MALTIPTTQDLADQNLTGLQQAVAQTAPLQDSAFLRVLAVIEALGDTGLYKYAAERALQNLILTATFDDLDRLGNEPGVDTPRKAAESAKVTATIPGTPGLTIGVDASFVSVGNGLTYVPDAAAVVAIGGTATLTLTCTDAGAAGNLQSGDTLTIVSQQAGIATIATVTTVENTGANEETDDAYRQRLLFTIRTVRGGGNATDYKAWGESVAGVRRAFPYAGQPGAMSYPGDRTVYVEADTTIDPDGIPTQGLLDEVRGAINIDPVTGKSHVPLGLTTDTLWVEPITRTAIDVQITNLICPAGGEAATRDGISSALSIAFLALAPYIEGVDLPSDRNDVVTAPVLSAVVQEVLSTNGATASDVAFSIASVAKTTYTLGHGELAKLGVISYVTV